MWTELENIAIHEEVTLEDLDSGINSADEDILRHIDISRSKVWADSFLIQISERWNLSFNFMTNDQNMSCKIGPSSLCCRYSQVRSVNKERHRLSPFRSDWRD